MQWKRPDPNYVVLFRADGTDLYTSSRGCLKTMVGAVCERVIWGLPLFRPKINKLNCAQMRWGIKVFNWLRC
jgi:hypothetical protein